MRLRMKSVLATLVATGMLAGMLGFAQVAHAAPPTPPPYEPDPGARGCLTFYDVNGNVVRSGNTSTSPPFAFALGDGPARSGDNLGTLYIAQPEPGQPSNAWLTDVISAGNSFPSTGPPTPANLRNRPEPLYIGTAGEATLATEQTVLPHPATDNGTPYQGAYQIRFITNGLSSGTDPLWWRADIQITGTTWTQTWCAPANVAQPTTTNLTVAPASPQPAGTTVNLTASVSPTVAVGTVQFQDNGTNLGAAVSTTAGSATTSTNSLAAGNHSLTAVFTPTDLTAFSGSTSNAVPYTITSAATSTDLSITKTGPATVTGGSPIAYALTATNNGPDAATGVVVTDTLPTGVTFVSASSSPGTCTNASGTVTCSIGNLASGASATITINATAPTAAGTITNTATITGTETDPNPANNTASANTQVTVVTGRSTDLSITKTGPATATASSPLTYTVKATNNGPDDATGVVVTDTLPSGVGFTSASSSQGTCTNASGIVTCNVGSLANGATATITINATAPARAGNVTNTVTITGTETDPNPANNTASASTQVGATTGGSADLSITKYAFAAPGEDDQFQVSNTFYYVLRVRNTGPSTATGVTVSDHLPAGVTFGKAFATNKGTCSQTAGTVTCDLGALKKGRTAVVAISVTATVTGTVTNTATVSGNQPDPNMKNNSSSVTITVADANQCHNNDGDCKQRHGWSALLGGLLGGLRRH